MKKIIIVIFITLSCTITAQTVYPLNTYPGDIPAGSYIKDITNNLDPYVGTWQATFQGKVITLHINKEIYREFRRPDFTSKYYADALIVRYSIEHPNPGGGQANLLSNNDYAMDETYSHFIASFSINPHHLKLFYSGADCGVGYGEILLKLQNANQFTWNFQPQSSIITTENCSVGANTAVVIPVTDNLVFTKQ